MFKSGLQLRQADFEWN